MPIKVLIHGTGFAGQGHAEAFRQAGAEIVGMVGRTESVVYETAKKMGIPYSSTSWPDALKECQPDIVSIGTPGGAHFEPVMQAMEQGCHVFCDKPMAESASNALKMYKKSEEKGVKTAYAASFRYMPNIIFTKQMLEEGVIGQPREAEFISHFNLDPAIPHGWSHELSQGGGRLNNNFVHLLSIARYVFGENLHSVLGQVRNDMLQAPVVDGVHNFMERRNFIPKDLNDPSLKWKDADAEWSYTVMAKIKSDYPADNPVSVLFKHGGIVPHFDDNHLVFYGSEGAIYIKGHYGGGQLYLSKNQGEWQQIDTSESITSQQPDVADDTLRSWIVLAQKLVDDLEGKPVEAYQGFKDGWEYQEIIESIRAEEPWPPKS